MTTGEKYKGAYHKGRRHGEGSWVSGSGDDIYDGQWGDDKKHGYGKLVTPELQYAGEWAFDTKTGQGRYQTGKELYEGSYVQDFRHGEGELVYLKTGEKYAGQWDHDIREVNLHHSLTLNRNPDCATLWPTRAPNRRVSVAGSVCTVRRISEIGA